jgi:HAE1 family hydrophobic/amphiphilic exporter-1
VNHWPKWVLSHRHAVIALILALLVLGIQARFELPVRLFPDTDPPTVTVITQFPGMAVADVDTDLTRLLEEEFASLDGMTRIRSSSQTGLSVIRVEFAFDRSSSLAAVDVQNAIGRVRQELPASINEPQVLEFSTADKPIVTLAIAADLLPMPELRELADNAMRDRLERVPGVAAVDIFGGYKLELHVAVDRDRLDATDIDMQTVMAVLDDWNLSAPGGRIDHGQRETVVRFDAPLASPEGIGRLVVRSQDGRLIRLEELAEVTLQAGEQHSAYRHNGRDAIAVQILRRDEANTVEVAAGVRQAVEALAAELPQIEITIADDDSVFTEQVISDMTRTVAVAVGLTMLIVLLFLADWRQALIIALSIPAAFLTTFVLMQLAGLDLNMVTMSALILAIGLLVDDGIVILENIHRHLVERDITSARAALEGTGEILGAKLGGTLTTLGVLVPLTFMGGFIGELFGPLAMTLAFALASSFVMSVTLIPLLAVWWLKPEGPQTARNPLTRAVDRSLRVIRKGYLRALWAALRHPIMMLGLAVLLLIASIGMLRLIGSEMLPRFDSGSFQVVVDTVPGTPIEDTVATMQVIEDDLVGRGEVLEVGVRVGHEPGARSMGQRGAMNANQAEVTVQLVPRTEREISQWALMDEVRRSLEQTPGVMLGVPKEMGGTARSSTAAPIVVRISGENIVGLSELGDQLVDHLAGIPGISDLYKDWSLDTPEVRVQLNHDRVSELGLSARAAAVTVHRAIDGQAATRYRQQPRRDLQVVVRYQPNQREQLDDLGEIVLNTPGGSVPLREIATLENAQGPRLLTREDGQRTLEILGYHTGRPLSAVVADVEARLSTFESPQEMQVRLVGEQQDFGEARARMLSTLMLSALAVYLLLVVQFSSFIHPATIMAAIPLQFIGVASALLLAGKYVSMPALLGVILLVGIVVNNSIILLDVARQRRANGASPARAVAVAVATRLRPILMTALSTIAGMLPLALELAVGAERFSPIATVIIGGILAATVLTLVVIPVLYVLTERVVSSNPAQEK